MAIAGKLDPSTVGDRLSAWLARKLDVDAVDVTDVEIPAASGFSAETLMFNAAWDGGSGRYVARVEPDGTGLFPSYDVIAEARVIDAIGDTVPVPTIVGAEDDPALLGTPFFVMERLDGRIPADDPPFTAAGWVIDELDAAGRRSLCENTLDAIAAVHAVDWKAAGLEFLARPEDGARPFDQYLAKLERFYDWASSGERGYPVIDATFEWLRANDPKHDHEPVLNWGDARLANVIYGDDLEVKAVLDWEMMSLNVRELEVGFFIWGQRHHTEGLGVPVPDGFLTPEEAVAHYERTAQRKTERVIDYYVPAAGLYSAVIFVRLGRLMAEAGLVPEGTALDRNNPSSVLLTRILGLEDTGNEAQSWVGRR
jgi:aminoglycoside phosphotransferase (APT) family kinase protein